MVITKFLLIALVAPLVSVLSSGCLREQDLLLGQYPCSLPEPNQCLALTVIH